MELSFFSSSPELIVAIVIGDYLISDPGGRFHPVVLVGKCLAFLEKHLFENKCWNKFGGLLLFILLSVISLSFCYGLFLITQAIHPWLAFAFLTILGSWLLAMKSLLEHSRKVSPEADGDLEKMRFAVSRIVGRDTNRMDEAGCRRATVESLAESLVDGILSPLFWLIVAGFPGLVIFKVISTMDSMVGYKNERYINFGWAGARLDDLFNWIPARLSWLSISLVSFLHPKLDGLSALKFGWKGQGHLPGYNSGWPEATMAGALKRRLVGPIYRNDILATDLWLGNPEDPECGSRNDLKLAEQVVQITTGLWMLVGSGALFFFTK